MSVLEEFYGSPEKPKKIISINEWCEMVHKTAVDHGWWENEPSFPEVIALIHSELSEALEEFRNGEAELYYKCKYHDTRTGCQYGKNEGCTKRKPEGIVIELADAVIRIFDYCGGKGIDLEEAIRIKNEYNKKRPYRHGGKII